MCLTYGSSSPSATNARRCRKLVANPVCPIIPLLWKGKEQSRSMYTITYDPGWHRPSLSRLSPR